MLPKHNRLDLRHQRTFFSKSRVLHTKILSLYWEPSEEECVKIACIVPKHVAHKATERNALKRKTRAATQALLSTLQAKNYVIVYHGAVENTYANIRKELSGIFAKTGNLLH